MKQVLVKEIKGTDNPADLGTKALSRDKIKKYLRTLGYRGDFVDEQENHVRRTKGKSNALIEYDCENRGSDAYLRRNKR